MISGRTIAVASSLALSVLGWLLYSSAASVNPNQKQATIQIQEVLGQDRKQAEGFELAVKPKEFSFPKDHGSHPTFQSEWWYLTGNLEADQPEKKRDFGFQLTLFRQAPGAAPKQQNASSSPQSDGSVKPQSAWRFQDIWMCHSAIADISQGNFWGSEIFARGALNQAGCLNNEQGQPHIWVQQNSIDFLSNDTIRMSSTVTLKSLGHKPIPPKRIQLKMTALKPIVPQGQNLSGLSQKGNEAGQASYYYSIPRLKCEGQVELDGQTIPVRGEAWLDREWSSRSLPEGLQGWDWVCLQFDQGSELMFYRLRQPDGQPTALSAGSFSDAKGVSTALTSQSLQLTPTRYWFSPDSKVSYPVEWDATLQVTGQTKKFHLAARLDSQEMPLSVRYWEGAIQATGDLTGKGYLEMVGYPANSP